MFRFLAADKVTDPQSAERILTKYLNRETAMSLDSQSFEGTIINVKATEGTLRVQFTWSKDPNQDLSRIEHVQRVAQSKVGSMIRFRVGTDEFVGLLSGLTELPKGATPERYIDSPFVLTFAFNAQDQKPIAASADHGRDVCACGAVLRSCRCRGPHRPDKIVANRCASCAVFASAESGIIGVSIPTNIVEQLPMDSDLEYEPHITVCYFPKLTEEDVEKILPLAREAAEIVGSFDVQVSGSTTFPTPDDDGKYPHVARIKSQGLVDFHDLFVELCEHHHPGLVDTQFALKNYNPHVTLRYTEDPTAYSPLKALAWNVDHLTLNLGKKEKFPISLSEGSFHGGAAVEKPYFQLGDVQVPVKVTGSKGNVLQVHLKNPSQVGAFEDLEGEQLNFVTKKANQEMEIVKIQKIGTDVFRLLFRSIVVYMPKEIAAKLRFVQNIAEDRGHLTVAKKLSKLKAVEEEEEPEDKEALGPAFPGTDSHIVTYVKAPQTQVIVEEPKFTRSLPLHERI